MWRRLRLRHLWLLLPFWLVAWRAGRDLADNSFLWHVRAGLDQLAAGEVIRTDPYSFTMAGEPWRTQSWLVELGYAQLEQWFGSLAWVSWFLFCVIALVLIVVLVGMLRTGVPLVAVAVTMGLVTWVFQPYMSPRPVLMSYVLFATIGVVVAARRPPLWAVPGLMWLWAALHGSFIVGLGMLVLDALRRGERRSWLAAAMSAVAVSVTAHGWSVWEILYRFAINRDGLERIQEWLPPDFTNWALLAVLPLLALLMVGLARSRVPVDALWIVIPMLLFALLSTRNVLPALLVMAPWLANAAGVLPDVSESESSPVVVWVTAVALAASAVVLVARPVEMVPERFPPPAAIAALDPAPVFHAMAPGAAMMYLEGSDRPVFVDDRVELYGAGFLEGFYDAIDGIEWRDVFAEWQIEQALLHEDGPLVLRLEDDGWERCSVHEPWLVLRLDCDS